MRDVSIIGAGSGAELDGIGIKIVRASDIVVRNLKIHHVTTGDKDGISIEGPADHVWIDHCELYGEYQGVDKDFYDGLIDVKSDAEHITYSWNHLHDSWKTSLVGSSEDDTFDRKLTMHHNYYRNCNSRLPLFRGGNGHVFNNYYVDIADTGINARIGACVRIEANYFENTRNPWVSAYSDELGAWRAAVQRARGQLGLRVRGGRARATRVHRGRPGYLERSQTPIYSPPALVGVWATAPYLHNGSVPTLDAVLDPSLRPTLSGHTSAAGLMSAQRRDLLEYLKTL